MSTTARETAICALEGATLTRRPGQPTFKNVGGTRNELSLHYAKAKITHPAFQVGDRFGLSAAVMKPKKFIRLHNQIVDDDDALDNDWEFDHPSRPKSYDDTIAANAGENVRRKKEAQRSEEIGSYDVFDGYETVFKDLLEDAYDAAYFRAIKDDVLGLSHFTVSEVLEHLEEQCLALTGLERATKLKEIQVSWDKNDSITTFFSNLDRLEDELADDYNIEWTTDLKILAAVMEMYTSGIFDRKEMMAWEDKEEEDKTWVHCQNYFGNLWTQYERFGGPSTRAHGYGESANQMDETTPNTPGDVLVEAMKEVAVAATADKEHIQQMTAATDDLVGVVKRQQEVIANQSKQIDSLLKQTQDLTAAVGKLTAGGGGGGGRPRGPRGGGGGADATRGNAGAPGDNGRPPNCRICNRGIHDVNKCFELEINKDKRPRNWKSVFAQE